jgi:Bacterial transglutaminase-like cysteine proteinase BTLCP
MAVYSQGLIHRLLTGFVRLAGGLRPFESPWDRVALRVPVAAFGPGSRRHFAHYFEGESGVRIESVDGIVEWLLTCEYVTDSRLFNESDRWQHPSSFEELRRGDCEDFALWTWRKLAELGIDSEFYVGRVLLNDEPHVHRQHAWVVFRVDDVDYLFEPAARDRGRMIRELSDAMNGYVPHFAVDRRLRTFAFSGYVADSDRVRRRSDAIAPQVQTEEHLQRY